MKFEWRTSLDPHKALENIYDTLQHIINKKIDVPKFLYQKLIPFFFQYHLGGSANPYRLRRNPNSGNVLLYIRERIPSILLISGLSIKKEMTSFLFLQF